MKSKRKPIYSGLGGLFARAVDSAVGLVLPTVAHSMRKSRIKSEALLSYEAADISRTNPITRVKSADADILPDLEKLRSMSRATVRDDAHAAALLRTNDDNVVGSGIRPQSACDPEAFGGNVDACSEWQRACEAEFERWSDHEADVTGAGNFYDLQRLVARTRKIDGECLVHATRGSGGSLGIELIDVDRLGSPGWNDTDTIRGGVEVDANGSPIRYHVLARHPDDTLTRSGGATWIKLEREAGDLSMVQHVFRRERAGQTRGVPDLAPALLYKRHLHHYLDSELIAARTGSAYALFIRRAADTSDPDIFPVQGEESGGATQEFHEVIEPGTIQYLNEGEDPVPFNPNRPGSNFDAFVTRILRAVCSSQGISYELVAKDFGGMNFSSARAMLLECRRTFDLDRALLTRQFNQPWYRNVIKAGVAAGRLKPPPAFLDNPEPFLRVRWVAPAYGWVDPTKEIEASTMAVQANLSTPYEEASRSGQDAESILEQRARFYARAAELEKQHGLPTGSLSGVLPPQQPNGQAPADPAEPAEAADPASPS